MAQGSFVARRGALFSVFRSPFSCNWHGDCILSPRHINQACPDGRDFMTRSLSTTRAAWGWWPTSTVAPATALSSKD